MVEARSQEHRLTPASGGSRARISMSGRFRNKARSIVFGPIERHLDQEAQRFLGASGDVASLFGAPAGEASFAPPDSVSWRVFKNPIALFIGGVAAVLLEFANPAVRAGVWRHSNFKSDPVGRLRRTGFAAMMTVYGPRGRAEQMIDGVRRMHARVEGVDDQGRSYRANDPALLNWVHATASFGFVEAYARYVAPLSSDDVDRFYVEGRPAARAYGAVGAPSSRAEQQALFAAELDAFEASPLLFEFMDIMRHAPALPNHLRLSQRVFVRAAVDLLPRDARDALGLTAQYGLRPMEGAVVKRLGRRADRLVLRSSPAVLACRRLGLPDDYLYRSS